MSKEPFDYSDPQDRVDYQIVKSYERSGRQSSKILNVYTIALMTVILMLLLMMLSQALAISSLKKRVSDLEARVTAIDGR